LWNEKYKCIYHKNIIYNRKYESSSKIEYLKDNRIDVHPIELHNRDSLQKINELWWFDEYKSINGKDWLMNWEHANDKDYLPKIH
jgi:hypothetical protein